MAEFVEVAVPLPLRETLTYAVPEAFARLARPGARVRVPVGGRRLVGVIAAEAESAPAGIHVRPLEAVLDHEPVLPEDLLSLAREAADYYLAPVGEVIQGMLPSGLPPWGDRRVWLTDAGALSLARTAEEGAILEALRDRGRLRVSELLTAVEDADLHQRLAALEAEGRIAVSDSGQRGARYRSAVELAAGSLDELLERCGRSRPGRQVILLLQGLGRPATSDEITAAVGCGPGVIRRLVSLGVLKSFTQIERLSLDGQFFSPADAGPPIVLRDDQAAAVRSLGEALDQGTYRGFLLAGITGSGKTEVYLRAAETVVAGGGSVLLLVPEIALVPALASLARQRFGERTAIFHSGLSGIERQQEWERIRQGAARVIVGPRSAVFTPARDLRLIVVDEEQDPAYKQDQIPRYHGRDVAVLRAHRCAAVALLASATPSLETRYNVEIGKLHRLDLAQRVGQGELPAGIVVDLRLEGASRRPGEVCISGRLQQEIEAALAHGDQVILLRNRRGYAPMLLCRACGEDFRCADCGLPQTLHRRGRSLRCHYCGSSQTIPESCPSCDKEALEPIGAGTERVEEQVQALWPEARVAVLDRDTARRGEATAVLEQFGRGENQILVGTQMVSKGHHFPHVVVTAVLMADTYLGFPDFRAVEKTYNLLTQVAGRAGRGDKPGRVIIQTFHPEHYAIQAALRHDDALFAEEETRFRRIFHYPPYTRMIQLLLRDTDRQRAESQMRDLATDLARRAEARGVRISGPAPAPFERLRGKWRYQILLRHRSGRQLRDLVTRALEGRSYRDLVVDVDPLELL